MELGATKIRREGGKRAVISSYERILLNEKFFQITAFDISGKKGDPHSDGKHPLLQATGLVNGSWVDTGFLWAMKRS